jgi:hypothetical protein
MRTLVIVLTMALITLTFTSFLIAPTLAQMPNVLNVPDVRGLVQPPAPSGPRTVPLMGKDGQQIGTATFSGNRIFLRNQQNEIFAQIVVDADGTRTMYDAHGKVLDRIEADKAAPK